MDIKELKEYLRIDFEEDDMLLRSLLSAAEEYLYNAGIKIDYKKPLYRLAIKLLVKHWYDNRDCVVAGNVNNKLEYSLNAILTQLRYCGDNNE